MNERIFYEIQRLHDRINHLLFMLTGGRQPFLSPHRGGDLAFQWRSDIAAYETLHIRDGYHRIVPDLTVDGVLVVDGVMVIL